MILIGSRAIKFHYEDFRNPKDWDVIVHKHELIGFQKRIEGEWRQKRENHFVCHLDNIIVEVWVITPNSSEQLIAKSCFKSVETEYGTFDIPSQEALAGLKRSHLYWTNNWVKHIEDYHFLRQFSDYNKAIFKLRREEHRDRFGKNHVNLRMSNERFFEKSQNKVKRIFHHDDLHKATCYYDNPLYKRCKHNNDQAYIDQDLFEQLCHSDKIRMVKEECYALALERVFIPNIDNGLRTNDVSAYQKWLMKLVTAVSTGWFREFVIENYPALKYPDKDYINEFVNALNAGKVRFYGSNNYYEASELPIELRISKK